MAKESHQVVEVVGVLRYADPTRGFAVLESVDGLSYVANTARPFLDGRLFARTGYVYHLRARVLGRGEYKGNPQVRIGSVKVIRQDQPYNTRMTAFASGIDMSEEGFMSAAVAKASRSCDRLAASFAGLRGTNARCEWSATLHRVADMEARAVVDVLVALVCFAKYGK